MRALRYPGVFSGMREILQWLNVERRGDRTIGILEAAREGDRRNSGTGTARLD